MSGNKSGGLQRASNTRMRPPLERMDTVLSADGERYSALPMPSPTAEETEASAYPEGYKPRIPYMSIYSSPSRLIVDFTSGFLAKTPVTVRIPTATRDVSFRHPLTPYLYTIEIQHGQFKWTIYKRFNHFRDLHEKLWTYKTSLKIPLPSKKHMRKRKTMKMATQVDTKIPRFPKRPDVWISEDLVGKRREQLELYLNAMLRSQEYRNHNATKKFFEISRFSFIQDLGEKGKEGVIRKKSGGHTVNLYFCEKCCNLKCRELLNKWSHRWFVVKDSFFMYMEPSKQQVKGVILFDSELKVEKVQGSSKLIISNMSRKLTVNCWTERQADVWKKSIEETAMNLAYEFINKQQRYDSFAPPREALTHWFVDGSSYMFAVADAIETAEEEIFITDWWLSPQIYMKRPMTQGDHWQLDKLLRRKADEGIKIYVLLYKEVEMAVALQSLYTKQILQSLNTKNIKVLRHPDHNTTTKDSLLWAHHEKIVVIDQSIAFIGGIDLCYGRWDNHTHPLTDLGSLSFDSSIESDVLDSQMGSGDTAGGISTMSSAFMMCQAMTVAVVEQVCQDESLPNTGKNGKVAVDEFYPLEKLSTASDDGSDKFQKTITEHKSDKPDGKSVKFAKETTHLSISEQGYGSVNDTMPLMTNEISLPETNQRKSHAGEAYKGMVQNMKLAGQAKLWVGKDYCNFISKDLAKLDEPYTDMMDRRIMPRMPWHDIACVTYGKAARDTARHFIQRWNFTKIEKAKKGETVPFLLPKAYTDDMFNIKANQIHPNAVNARVQVLRSSCAWSAGIYKTEHSIQNAYLDAINKAEHFIYIENQFFISVRNNYQIHNKIVDALYHRIMRAHSEKKKFRVYIVMPLIPGFEGDIRIKAKQLPISFVSFPSSDSSQSLAIQAVMDWQRKSINRGTGSLMGDLTKQIGPNSANYLSFCGLRTHSSLGGKPVTEIIYVHSKMLIVDDRKVIIGSANINDRSMTGERDSEVAILVEDTEMLDSTMDEKPFKVGKFASSLRKKVFSEHLGLLPSDYEDEKHFRPTLNIDDVVCESFFKDIWLHTAGVNTTVYEKIFKCVPSDLVKSFSEIENFQKSQMTDVQESEKELTKICGYLVLVPLYFLHDEVLAPEGITKEAIAPTSLWT